MKFKRQVWKIATASVIYMLALINPWNALISLGLFTASYLLAGTEIIRKAVRNIIKGRVFDENFLMAVATLGAVALQQYSEAVAVMLFYQIGELFQSYAVNKSRRSVAALLDIRPDYANLQIGEVIQKVNPEQVKPGDVIVIKPGERVPLDGLILKGNSTIDTSALSGEAMPREFGEGDEINNGCVNLSGVLEVRVTRPYSESTVVKILDLVENASSKKAKIEQFITRFARYYTPAVVVLAMGIAFIPPLVVRGAVFIDWVYRALTFLVISCPCALVISVPLSFFGGIGAASKNGILVKGSNFLQALADTEIVVFDKTGTLTKGSFSVSEIKSNTISEAELLKIAAYAGAYSSHPVSQSIVQAFGNVIDNSRISRYLEIPGQGVSAEVDGQAVISGNHRLMRAKGIEAVAQDGAGTVNYVAINGKYAGWIRISDTVKEDAASAIKGLHRLGIDKIVMLTGDRHQSAEQIAEALGVDDVYGELLPAQKVEKVEELMASKNAGGKLVFVGDGINDAPVLARADIGVAMGGMGSDAAVEAADVVLMTDEPSKLVTAIKISQKTLRIVKQNIVFALSVKAVVLVLGAWGMATMWEAVFADVGVSVLAILNAIRALKAR